MKKALFAVLILTVSNYSTFACDCEPWYDNVKDWFLHAPIAFEGGIISIEDLSNQDTTIQINEKGDTLLNITIIEKTYSLYHVRVTNCLKNTPDTPVIKVKAESYSSCSPFFKKDKKYIIFATSTDEEYLYTNNCYGSNLSTKDDLQQLMNLKENCIQH